VEEQPGVEDQRPREYPQVHPTAKSSTGGFLPESTLVRSMAPEAPALGRGGRQCGVAGAMDSSPASGCVIPGASLSRARGWPAVRKTPRRG
jgi:hypothetical protein